VSQKQINETPQEDQPSAGQTVDIVLPPVKDSSGGKQQGCCKNL